MRFHFFPFPFLVGLAILAVLLISARGKRSLSYRFFLAVFGMYLLLVVRFTLFSIPLPDGGPRQPAGDILAQVNLIPLEYGDHFRSLRWLIFREVIGNILLTVPFGFLLPFITRVRPKAFLWPAVGVGLAIEAAQLAASILVGAAYRTVDINDVFFNTLGALLGYAGFLGFAWLYVAVSHLLEARHRGPFAYLYAVARRAFQPQS